ncbi:MAG: hypothetical protein RSD04_00665 [Clostridia bacterium]
MESHHIGCWGCWTCPRYDGITTGRLIACPKMYLAYDMLALAQKFVNNVAQFCGECRDRLQLCKKRQ